MSLFTQRPLQDVMSAFVSAGFSIDIVTEPRPVPETPAELLPHPDGRAFICFLFFGLHAN